MDLLSFFMVINTFIIKENKDSYTYMVESLVIIMVVMVNIMV